MTAKEACAALVNSVGQGELATRVDEDHALLSERHSFAELVDPNGLTAKYPWMLMSASQRYWDLIKSSGVEERVDRRNGFGKVKRYAFFSDGLELTNGKHIVGQ